MGNVHPMSKPPVVVKFGGTSVGSLERIQATAESVAAMRASGSPVIVVVSAMAGETDRLLGLGHRVNGSHAPESLRELDSLVATGEQASAALLALALHSRGVPARSFTAHQFPFSLPQPGSHVCIVKNVFTKKYKTMKANIFLLPAKALATEELSTLNPQRFH